MSPRQRMIAKVGAFIWIPAFALMLLPFAFVEPERDANASGWFLAPMLIAFGGFIVSYAAIVLMIKHVYTESDLSERWQLGWTALLLFFNVLAAAVYWFRHMAYEGTEPNSGR